MRAFCIEVFGELACFDRPEMKLERVSYDVMTPAAARSVFDSILWKPAIRWRVRRIEVLRPINWILVRRNEIFSQGSVYKTRHLKVEANLTEMHIGVCRSQHSGLFLRDVGYRLHADLVPVADDALKNPCKYHDMFQRRASSGLSINQPYLGCREFLADFKLVSTSSISAPPIPDTRDLGWMPCDSEILFSHPPRPMFFRAYMQSGVIDLLSARVFG